MNILSIDLAVKRYTDFGFAYLESGSRTPVFLKPDQLGLYDPPSILQLAAALFDFCTEYDISVLLIDGPQGWKDPASGLKYMRIAERVLNTPGKTGVVGHVKPASYTDFTIFSVTLFQTFRQQYGWNLLTPKWASQKNKRFLVEAFPTAAWRTLGLDPLPGKSRAKGDQLQRWRSDLQRVSGYSLPEGFTHDELQAAVLLPVGEAIIQRNPQGLLLLGARPLFTPAGDVLEGWIAVPVRSGSS
ncbi:MAG: hypothetical protein JXA25_19090 [Anaerolineales bacterium]|nr:hypothetical protein [Anaerolineales bacterium]